VLLPDLCGDLVIESGGVLNRTSLPSDIIAFVMFYRLRYRLTLRDLSEILLLRGIEVSHEAVRDWETKLPPIIGEELRKRRHGKRRGPGVRIAGVAFEIMGVQARRLPEGGTSVCLPTFKDEGGVWRPAIKLPDEVRAPLADAVLAFLLEEGLARRKFEPGVG
jgi:hypothetical protein